MLTPLLLNQFAPVLRSMGISLRNVQTHRTPASHLTAILTTPGALVGAMNVVDGSGSVTTRDALTLPSQKRESSLTPDLWNHCRTEPENSPLQMENRSQITGVPLCGREANTTNQDLSKQTLALLTNLWDLVRR